MEEPPLGGGAFGSTRLDIAPFYADIYSKVIITGSDLFTPEILRTRVDDFVPHKTEPFTHSYGEAAEDAKALNEHLLTVAPRLAPRVSNPSRLRRTRSRAARRLS